MFLLPCLRRRTLADIIMEKLTEKQTEVETVMSEATGFPMPQLDPRVLEVYRGVREVRAKRAYALGYPDRRWPLTLCLRQISHSDPGQDWGRAGGLVLPLTDPGSPPTLVTSRMSLSGLL